MSELIENIDVTVDDAPVATVPLVDNFTADNAAPKASAVGTALASKVDASAVMEHVTITVDGQESDNQGVILLYGDDIPVDDTNNAPTVKAAISAVDAKTAADINYAIGVSIKDKIDAVASDVATVGAKTANEIIYADTTTIKTKVDAVETAVTAAQAKANSAVLVSAQTLTDAEKLQARTNVGAVGVAEAVLVDSQSLTTSQQAQARANIAAISSADAVSVNAQTLTTSQQTQVRANIGAASADIETMLTDALMIENYTYTISSLAAGASVTISASDFEIIGMTGYTPIAVANYYMNNNLSINLLIPRTSGSVLSVRNNGTSAVTNSTVNIGILWAKNGLL